MNAFWIPRLGGMIYAMPGMRTELHLIADKGGKFRGSSSQISGKGFAGMTFETEATSEADYQQWIQSVKQSKNNLNWTTYQKIAEPSENNPVEFYRLTDNTLFNEIIMKFMKPPENYVW